jgi:hypothetical protein
LPEQRSELELLSDAYEEAEATFLNAVREVADRARLATAARAVAVAAANFNREAYRRFHTCVDDAWMPLDHLTERTEVLKELWRDMASAYAA